jgi:adenylate cyclase
MRDKIIPIILGLALTLLAVFAATSNIPEIRKLIDGLNNIFYDIHLKTYFHKYAALKTPVIIIDIDEKSLQAEGKWPWPRDKLALLVKQLKNQGVTVVAFDMLFSEPDKNYAQEVFDTLALEKENVQKNKNFLAELKNITPYFENDKMFADALATGDTVLGTFLHNNPDASKGLLPDPIALVHPGMEKTLVIPKMTAYLSNIPILQNASKWAGFTTTIADDDGLLRRSPLLLRYENKIYPSLALAATRLYLLIDTINLDISHIGHLDTVENIRLGNISIPTDAQGRMIIPYRGPARSFPYYSATDILHKQLKPGILNGTLAFVGTSSFGLGDTHPTPLQNIAFPGVEVHANIAATILNNTFLYNPAWGKGLEVSLLIIIGALFGLLFPFLSSGFILLIATLAILLLIIIKPMVWVKYGLVLPEIISLLLVFGLVMVNMAYGYLAEQRRRNEIKNMFGRYVPPSHVDQMLKSHNTFSSEGESKEMTVLFADVRSFTSISESLTPPGVKKFLNVLFTPMTKIIFDRQGTIDKYVGDMIMAFWGAPLADATHAQHALQAALEMLEAMKTVQAKFTELGLSQVNIGIGLNTGIMSVGDMGSEYRQAYTVLGDEVNLASRLEASTKFYHVNLIVSEPTMRYNPDYLYRQLDVVKVKGKKHAIRIYQPLCKISEASPEKKEELKQYEQALDYYFARKWQAAKDQFTVLSEAYADVYVYQMYLERVAAFIIEPPEENWDGSYTRTEK